MAETTTAARDILDTIRPLVETGDWSGARDLAVELHPADLAEVVAELEPSERTLLFEYLPGDVIGRMLEFVAEDALAATVEAIPPADLPSVLEDVADDVVADVLQQLGADQQATALASLDLDQAEEVQELLRYAAESAGGIMTREYVALQARMSVQQAIDFLRVLRPPSDRIYYLYVIDEEGRLVGTVSIRDILVSPPGTPLEAITRRDIHLVRAGTDQEEVARMLQRYDLLAIPVVDDEDRLEGVVTVDDVIDVLQEEATEDMFRMVGIEEGEKIAGPVGRSVRNRLPWLAVNFGTAILAAGTVALFSDTIARAAILATFMPVVAGMGGNAGAQTATIAVRSMALGELGPGGVLSACRKELVVGILNGIAIGVLGAVVAYAWDQNVTLALVLGIALVLTLISATLGGVVVPLALRWAGVDPALAASIFVTTLTDVAGFLFFLGLAAIVVERL